jgi:hypothetical protein
LTNDWYNQLVAIGNLSYAARLQAIADFETKFDRWKQQCRAAPWISITDRISTGERIAARATSSMTNALSSCYKSESRAETLRRAAILLCDIELFRRDQGHFPDDLGQLAPHYCSAVPSDAFADSPFIYRKDADGCKLYSRGRNQIDEQGRGYEEGDFDDTGFTIGIERRTPEQS